MEKIHLLEFWKPKKKGKIKGKKIFRKWKKIKEKSSSISKNRENWKIRQKTPKNLLILNKIEKSKKIKRRQKLEFFFELKKIKKEKKRKSSSAI